MDSGVNSGAYAFAPIPGYDQLLLIKNISHADGWVYAGAYAFALLPGYEQLPQIKNTSYADSGVYMGEYAFALLLGCDQFLPKKNTIYADSRVHAGAYAIRSYLGVTNFYRERILPMRMSGHMRGRMQYAPTGLRPTSTDKKYQLCRRPGTFWGVCNTSILGCDQFLPRKNTTHAESGVHTGAYAIRPYRVMNNFY